MASQSREQRNLRFDFIKIQLSNLTLKFNIYQVTAKADEKKKVSTATTSGDKTSSAVGGKKKPITQKPGVPQKDSKSPAGVSGVARASSTRQKDTSKNVTKPKTASESDNTSLSSNEGKKKPKSEPPPSKSQTR